MTEAIKEFIYTYYIHPITYDTGYNPVNTITWALMFGLIIFVLLKILKKLGIAIDKRFVAVVSPYIFVAASLRVMEDADLFSPPISYMLITPLIYFLIFFCCVAILVLLRVLSGPNRINDYMAVFGLIGVLWFITNLILLLRNEAIVDLWVLFAVIGISGMIILVIYVVGAKLHAQFLTESLNVSVLTAHLLDASSSYIGIDFLGYQGKHVIEGMIVEFTGSAIGMFPLKLGILIPVLYLLDIGFDEREIELKNLVLLALIVIGLAPAVRNTLRMVLGV
ncbi:putative membrane protein [Methanophagales archaeon]|nr:putative membrane protein [Methanophagales archaeon]